MEPVELSAQYRELLLHTPPFDGLPSERADQMLEQLNYAIYRIVKGDVVARQGESCNQLYILLEGRLQGDIIDVFGNRILVEHLEAPRVLAAPHLFATENTLPSTFTAMGVGILFTATRDSVFALISEAPDILRKFLFINGNCNQCTTQRLRVLSYKGIRERVAVYLLDQLMPGCDTTPILHNNSQLAEYLNVTRPALSKEMNKLKREGVIAEMNHRFRILNPALLREVVIQAK